MTPDAAWMASPQPVLEWARPRRMTSPGAAGKFIVTRESVSGGRWNDEREAP